MSTSPNPANRPCPCGSGKPYARCCRIFHRGEAVAPTAEHLMRSRYAAFALGLDEYLLDTWADATRPGTLEGAGERITWIGLEIRDTRGGRDGDRDGEVEFVARGIVDDHLTTLQETSRFIRERGRWCYVDGDLAPDTPIKIGRNAPCPCGSGHKFKRCHGR